MNVRIQCQLGWNWNWIAWNILFKCARAAIVSVSVKSFLSFREDSESFALKMKINETWFCGNRLHNFTWRADLYHKWRCYLQQLWSIGEITKNHERSAFKIKVNELTIWQEIGCRTSIVNIHSCTCLPKTACLETAFCSRIIRIRKIQPPCTNDRCQW